MGEKEKGEIMWMFRYTYRNKWCPEKIFNGKSRVWINEFNKLVKTGFIVKRKGYPGSEYKWGAAFPEKY